MNIKALIELVKASVRGTAYSRAFFFVTFLTGMIGPMVYMFLWMFAANSGSIDGYSRNDFAVYYIIYLVLNMFTIPNAHWVVGENIQVGTISVWLTKPVPVIFHGIAGDISSKIVSITRAIIVIIVFSYIFRIQLIEINTNPLLITIILLLASILRFMLAYTVALLAFWTQKIDSLLRVNDTLVLLFAGQIAPVEVLPQVMKNIAYILPFRYMLSFPIETLMGKLNYSEIIFGLVIQLIWVFIVIVLSLVIWKEGVKKYNAIGG